MRKARFFIAEALRSIRANVAVAIAATTTVAIAVFVLGAFIPSFLFVQSAVDATKDRIDVRAWISDPATTDQVEELEAAIVTLQNDGLVESYEFISKERAYEIMRDEILDDPTILDDLPGNPFPRSFVVKPQDPDRSDEIITALGDLPAIDPSEGVTDGGETTNRLLEVARFIQWTGLGLIVILMIASLLLIANTIRLSVFARRREVEIMRLVGGTNWFIRWPFVIEGILCGLVGAVLAVALLYGVKIGVVDKWIVENDEGLTRNTATTIGFTALAGILVLAGAVVGALGSGITIRRFLKV